MGNKAEASQIRLFGQMQSKCKEYMSQVTKLKTASFHGDEVELAEEVPKPASVTGRRNT